MLAATSILFIVMAWLYMPASWMPFMWQEEKKQVHFDSSEWLRESDPTKCDDVNNCAQDTTDFIVVWDGDNLPDTTVTLTEYGLLIFKRGTSVDTFSVFDLMAWEERLDSLEAKLDRAHIVEYDSLAGWQPHGAVLKFDTVRVKRISFDPEKL